MKFVTTKHIIDNTISTMQPFLDKKDSSLITSHIYLETINSTLILKATDHDVGLEYKIDGCQNSEDGKATVNGQNLINIIKRLKDSEIIFEVENNHLIIKQNRSNFKLPMFDANEYPSFPESENLHLLDVSMLNLINSIKKITPAIDSNNPKFELNGASIDIKINKINFAATDTRRLATTYIETNQTLETNQIIVPKKAIVEIQKLFLDESKILYNNTFLVIQTENTKFFTKLINGKFPDYERIIPNSLKYKLNLSKSMLVESIKLVTSLFDSIKITFEPNLITFESLDEESESKTQCDIDLNIDESFYLAVNAKFLLDFLATSNNEKITIGFNESNLPFLLEDEKFQTVIMPIVLEK